MKELSIEEIAKAYDNLIERLKDLKFAYRFSPLSDTIEEKFPELKESEDEKIRKELIKYIRRTTCVNFIGKCSKKEAEKFISWIEKQGKDNMSILEATKQELENNLNETLEKETPESWNEFLDEQGEQKPVDKVEPKFKVGDYVKNVNDKREPIYEIVYIDKECYICEYRGKENIGDKAVMHFAFDYPYLRHTQTPAWSEEDKGFLNLLLAIFTNEHPNGIFSTDNIPVFNGNCVTSKRIIAWLKFLRDRYTWKPSDEQMEILQYLCETSSHPNEKVIPTLESLYQDLKKLRKE